MLSVCDSLLRARDCSANVCNLHSRFRMRRECNVREPQQPACLRCPDFPRYNQ